MNDRTYDLLRIWLSDHYALRVRLEALREAVETGGVLVDPCRCRSFARDLAAFDEEGLTRSFDAWLFPIESGRSRDEEVDVSASDLVAKLITGNVNRFTNRLSFSLTFAVLESACGKSASTYRP